MSLFNPNNNSININTIRRVVQNSDILYSTMRNAWQMEYKIPDFQREYVWKEHQVSDLLNDFIDFSNHTIAQIDKQHFIGTITVCPDITSASNQLLLIDGQQRFTTIILIIHALKTIICRSIPSNYSNSNYTDLISDLNCLLYADYKISNSCNSPRLTLISSNDQYMRNTISMYYKNQNPITNNAQKKSENESLEIAFYTIYSKINELYEKLTNNNDKIVFIESLLRKTVTNLEYKEIRLAQYSDAPIIFEALNNRGKVLVACELIKNRVFLNLHGDSQEQTYQNLWITLNSSFKSASHFDKYIRYYYMSKIGNTSASNLADNVLKYIDKNVNKTKSLIDELIKYLDVYRYFYDKDFLGKPPLAQGNNQLSQAFDWLRDDYIRNGIAEPYATTIIRACDLSASSQQLYDIAYWGFNFFFMKLKVCRLKAIKEFVPELQRKARESKTINDLLNNTTRIFTNKLDKTKFVDYWTKFKFESYPESKTSAGYTIIRRFESQQWNNILSQINRHVIEVEHIFPNKHTSQKWSNDIQNKKIGEDDLYKLGNLILLEQEINGSVGNSYCVDYIYTSTTKKGPKPVNKTGKFTVYKNGKAATKKRNAISPTVLNEARRIMNYTEWGTKEIDTRTSEMINGATYNGFNYKGLVDLFPIQ